MDRTVDRPVAIALGSNLGDRRAALDYAAGRLASVIHDLTLSDPVETEPHGEDLRDQPLYLNAVAVGRTALQPAALLAILLEVENAFGRQRPYPGAPRTLDLDLILLGDVVADVPGLRVPHPRFRERFFVLGPLTEVAPRMVDPVTGLEVRELLRNLLMDEER